MEYCIFEKHFYLKSISTNDDEIRLLSDDLFPENLEVKVKGKSFLDIANKYAKLSKPPTIVVKFTVPVVTDAELKQLENQEKIDAITEKLAELKPIKDDIDKLQSQLEELKKDYNG